MSEADSFFAVDPAVWGRAELRRRQTADHEAVHAAAAAALGWRVLSAEINADGTGGCVTHRPIVDLGLERRQREELAITLAASELSGDRSGADMADGWKLAATIAGNGEWALATNCEVNEVLDEARRDAYRLAESPVFERVRHLPREALIEFERLDEGDLDAIIGTTTRRRRPAVKSTTAPRKTAKTSRTKSKGCTECGYAYAPPDPSGQCFPCREDLS
jgi:hypothetical protein